MTRKDYILVAKALRGEIETADAMYEEHGAAALRLFADALAHDLQLDNPRFNRETFLRAAGV